MPVQSSGTLTLRDRVERSGQHHLHAPAGAHIEVDGRNIVPVVHAVLDRMAAFAECVRSGAWTGHTGKRVRQVIRLGTGGSDLGPVVAYEATRDLDPAEILFIVCSKTFNTQETLSNAHAARDWVVQSLGDERANAKHFVAGHFHNPV